MSGGCPLFRITRALASRCDKDKLAASSYQETTKAVLAGASGTFWRNMLLDLAWIAARSGQSFDACCALLAEVIVACADECAGIKSALASCSATNARGEAPHVCSEPAAKRARTDDKELACAVRIAGFVRAHGHAVHQNIMWQLQEGRSDVVRDSTLGAIALLAEVVACSGACRSNEPACSPGIETEAPAGRSRACTRPATNGARDTFADPHTAAVQIAELVLGRGRGGAREFLQLLEARRGGVLRSVASGGEDAKVAQNKHADYGKCPIGHLSVRRAEGSGGIISVKVPKNFSGSVSGQSDGYRVYSPLNVNDTQMRQYFDHLRRVIGATQLAGPSVFKNKTGAKAPVRQLLHVDGAPSVIVPISETGCQLDCLMMPSSEEGDSFYYRVTFFVPAGNCVVFNTFHGGARGNGRTEALRVHAYAAFGDGDAVPPDPADFGKRTLETMLETGEAEEFLRNIPGQLELEAQVGGAVSVVCKVHRDTGKEFDPDPHHL